MGADEDGGGPLVKAAGCSGNKRADGPDRLNGDWGKWGRWEPQGGEIGSGFVSK